MKNYKELLFSCFVRLILVWVLLAFSFQITMLFMSYYNPKYVQNKGNQLIWTFDGNFNKK